MRVITSKYDLLFIVKDITSSQQLVVNAQRMVPYPIAHRGMQASKDVKE